MGSRMFLLMVLVLLILTDHSQGVPETPEQSLTVNTDAFADGEVLTTANPINKPKRVNQLCKCEGKEGKMEGTHCLCQKSTRLKSRNLRKVCQKSKNKNLKKCRWFSKKKNGNGRMKSPSVPI